jgi:hypothetical protein
VKAAVREWILRVLCQAHPFLTPEKTLFYEVAGAVNPPPTQSDFEEQLRCLENKRLVLGITEDEVTGRRKWKATDSGVAWVRERGA